MTEGWLPLPLPRQAAAEPGRLALRAAGRDVSYAALADRADDLARRLAALGAAEGERVAIRLGGTMDDVALVHAVARLGAVLVPLHPRATAGEAAWQVARARPRVVVGGGGRASDAGAVAHDATDENASRNALDAASEDLAGADALDAASKNLVGADALDAAIDAPAIVDLERLLATPPRRVALAERVALGAPQAIVFTSGTSGRPKGAVLTWGNQVASAAASALRLGALPDDRWLVPLPLAHVGGLAVLLRCALAGAAVLLHARFDAAEASAALDDDSATLASLVPTMLSRLLEARGDRPAPPHLRAVLLGGGPASPALLAEARRRGFPVAPTYGLTETASQVATAHPGAFDDDAPAALPLPLAEVRVVGADLADAERGTEGEIWVRGPMIMAGYWDDPAATAAALRDGWLRTGDLGTLDHAGRLRVAARREDLILSGGENVYPAEVEAVLAEHPDVAAVCVVGVYDADLGQRVAAAVELRDGAEADEAALEAFSRARLAGFKLPRRWLLLGEGDLPRTASGKVRRGQVAGRLETSSSV